MLKLLRLVNKMAFLRWFRRPRAIASRIGLARELRFTLRARARALLMARLVSRAQMVGLRTVVNSICPFRRVLGPVSIRCSIYAPVFTVLSAAPLLELARKVGPLA